MINLLKEATDAATSGGNNLFALAAIVLGGTGFWKLFEIIFQAKREDKKENTVSAKEFKELSDNIKDIKHDLELLQKANKATVEYREMRDKQDQANLIKQDAVIKALTGIMRDRLLETYERCMTKGYYTIDERDIYSKLYECYIHAPFDGNGTIKHLRDVIVELPTTKEEAEDLAKKKRQLMAATD